MSTSSDFEDAVRASVGDGISNDAFSHGFNGLAGLALAAISRGMILRIDHADGSASLVESHARYGKNRPSVPVPDFIAKELLESGRFTVLTADRFNHKIGWKELGLDGSTADFFLCVQ